MQGISYKFVINLEGEFRTNPWPEPWSAFLLRVRLCVNCPSRKEKAMTYPPDPLRKFCGVLPLRAWFPLLILVVLAAVPLCQTGSSSLPTAQSEAVAAPPVSRGSGGHEAATDAAQKVDATHVAGCVPGPCAVAPAAAGTCGSSKSPECCGPYRPSSYAETSGLTTFSVTAPLCRLNAVLAAHAPDERYASKTPRPTLIQLSISRT